MHVIGICGPSGSGKSTIARMLKKKLGGTIISLDNYFCLPTKFKKYNEQGKDLELPQNIDWPKINEIVNSLIKKGKAEGQKVNWKLNKNEKSIVKAKNYLIIEGFLLFHNKKILDKMDLAIYLDIPDKEGIKRRVKRENTAKNKKWFEQVTFPEYKKRRKKFEERASLVIDATKTKDDILKIILKNI